MKSTSQRNQGVNDIGKLVYLGFVLSFSFGAHLWQFTRSTLARRRGLKFWPDFLRQYRQHALNIFFILLFWSQGTPRVHLSISTLFIKRASNNAQVHCSLVFSFCLANLGKHVFPASASPKRMGRGSGHPDGGGATGGPSFRKRCRRHLHADGRSKMPYSFT